MCLKEHASIFLNEFKRPHIRRNLNILRRSRQHVALSHKRHLGLHPASTIPCLPLHQQIKHNARKVGGFAGVGQ
jgi:hypothetical protein